MPVLAALSREEGGVFTAAQAVGSGVPRDAISYALRTGKLERVARGAYRLSGTVPAELHLAVALWKLTDPATPTHERLTFFDGVAVGGRTAAFAWGAGDLHPYPCRIYAPCRCVRGWRTCRSSSAGSTQTTPYSGAAWSSRGQRERFSAWQSTARTRHSSRTHAAGSRGRASSTWGG